MNIMNRRSFFRVLPIAASPVAMAATALAYSRDTDNLPPEKAGVGFTHGTPVGEWPDTQFRIGGPITTTAQYHDVKHHGSIIMHEGELYIRKPGGQWRQVS